jgi:hypothetical protein
MVNDPQKVEPPGHSKAEHPVWNVYDEFRTARLSVRYFEYRLKRIRFWNFWMEFILALTVSSGFAGLWIWNTSSGGIIWKILLSIAAVLAVVKPLVNLSEKIQQSSELVTKWRSLDMEFQKLTIKIFQYKKYDDDMRKQLFNLLDVKSAINEPTEAIDEKLRAKCSSLINNVELPTKDFYVPEEINGKK